MIQHKSRGRGRPTKYDLPYYRQQHTCCMDNTRSITNNLILLGIGILSGYATPRLAERVNVVVCQIVIVVFFPRKQ